MPPQDLLFEIGVEELPSSYVARALEVMPELFAKQAAQLRLAHGAVEALGTPRRLALRVHDVADAQSDVDETVVGPPMSIAFDANGAPTAVAGGFAAKLGGKTEDLIKNHQTPKGLYVAFPLKKKGEPTIKVLPDALAKLSAEIPFAKSMRWGAGEVAFGRPVQWLVARLGDAVLPVDFAGHRAGDISRGHRFLANRGVTIGKPADYVDALRSAHVLVDPVERRRVMMQQLHAAAKEAGGELVEDEGLADECLSLVEEPHVIEGWFDEKYLKTVPKEVIVAVMRGHQRYFAITRPGKDELLPKYLTVVNTAKDKATIKAGNDRVLRARLADAEFFIHEDQKVPLAERAKKLDGLVFQTKLGSVGEKARRLETIAGWLFDQTTLLAGRPKTFGSVLREDVARAARLAKADLVTQIVGEFPELQGVMGRWYALHETPPVSADVANAVRDHYTPKGASDTVPTEPISVTLALADRFDTLVGCMGVGLAPTGSADPFALRRAALGVIRICLETDGIDVELPVVARHVWQDITDQGKKLAPQADTVGKVEELFIARLRAMYGQLHTADLGEACIGAWRERGVLSIRDLDARVRAVASFRALPEAESLAVAFKRAYNMAKDTPPGTIDPARFTEAEEKGLGESFIRIRESLDKLVKERGYQDAMLLVARELRAPIDTFFQKVFVMVDDVAVRENRLRLLRSISDTVRQIAHFELLGERAT